MLSFSFHTYYRNIVLFYVHVQSTTVESVCLRVYSDAFCYRIKLFAIKTSIPACVVLALHHSVSLLKCSGSPHFDLKHTVINLGYKLDQKLNEA